MRRKIVSIVIVIIALLGAGIVYCVRDAMYSANKEKDTYDSNIDILNDLHPTDIILYGEEISFRETLKVRKIDAVSEANLKTSKEHQIIILSDLNGSLKITDEELLFIKQKIDSFECDFYYLGENLQERLKKLEFIDEWPADEYCVALYSRDDIVYSCYGVWTKRDKQVTGDNRESLGHALVSSFVRKYKET